MKPQPRYQPGDRIGGRYQVHKALMGGMGEVYLCLDLEEMVPYALKTFQQRYLKDTQRLQRALEEEVNTWVAFENHPNIVRCFLMEILDSQPFIHLEWIAGEEGRGVNLREWLQHGPIGLKLALEIAIDVCQGLIYAQQKHPGLVHRDLKPENILMTKGGLAKITDFGLAEIVAEAGSQLDDVIAEADGSQRLAGDRGIVGTPAYMAPEQWQGGALDVRTDIYAVGCVLYEMLTGTSPFAVESISRSPMQFQTWLQIMKTAHESTPAPRLPEVLPVALDELMQSCLAKTQRLRPTNLDGFLIQLMEIYRQQFKQPPPSRPIPDAFTAVDYTNRGITYTALKQYDKAVRDFEYAIALAPAYTDAYYNRGTTYHALKQYDKALADFGQAIALAPTDAQAYANRGNTYTDLKQYDQALADYRQAIELDPILVQAYSHRGNTYAALKQYNQALADYSQAIDLNQNYAQVYYNRGHTYHELQNYDLALEDYEQAIALAPTMVEAYCGRGNAYAALQQYEQALSDFEVAIGLDPNDAEAYTNRGNTYASLKQYKQALVDYEQAITLAPSYAQVYYNRGSSYAALHEHDQALNDYGHAIDLDPNYVMAYLNRGVSYMEMQEYKQALVDFGKAIALDDGLALAYSNRGNTYSALREYNKGLADYDRALALDPNYSQTYYNRGNTYAALARHEQALADYNKAIALNPDYVRAYSNRGATYAALQRYEQALADYNKAIQLDPTHARAYVNLGVFFEKHNMPEKALQYYEQAAKLGLLQAEEYADDIRQWLGLERTPRVNPEEAALTAFMEADTVLAMKQAVLRFPSIVEADFIVAIEQFIARLAPPELRPVLNQRLGWLQEIVNNQKPGLWARLFSKRRG